MDNLMYDGHLGKILLHFLEKYEDDINQIDVATGLEESHGSVRSRVVQTAKVLKSRGAKIGDIIVICVMSHNDATVPIIASICIGMAPLNLDPRMTNDRLEYTLTVVKPTIIFTDPSMTDRFEKLISDLQINANIIVFDKYHPRYETFTSFYNSSYNYDEFECAEFDPETTTSSVICPSGTSSIPKIIIITHRVMSSWLFLKHPMENLRKDIAYRSMTFAPICWISGLVAILRSIVFGYTRLHSSDPFTAELAFNSIHTYKPHALYLNPNEVYEMINYSNYEKFDLSSIQIFTSGGSAFIRKHVNAFEALLNNVKISSIYGSTELGLIATGLGFDTESVGKPAPWIKWKIVDLETDEQLGPNQPGELVIRSDYMFKEYYKNPVLTAASYDKDGYFKTGDIVYYDTDDNFYYVSRCFELIITRHGLVSPTELQKQILTLPEVAHACVVSIPDEDEKEVPMAFIQLAKGKTISAEQIKNVFKDTFPDHKQLKGGVVFLDKLPRTITGKINLRLLSKLKLTVKGE